jgi:hypothetical protein
MPRAKQGHDPQCFLHDHSEDELFDLIRANIDKHYLHIVGVFNAAPAFTYTIGLSPRVGYELIMVGVDPRNAAITLNSIRDWMRTDTVWKQPEFDKPYDGFANVPIAFRRCGSEAQNYNDVARTFYGVGKLPMTQVVFGDRQGRLPGDAQYDHGYMDSRQALL